MKITNIEKKRTMKEGLKLAALGGLMMAFAMSGQNARKASQPLNIPFDLNQRALQITEEQWLSPTRKAPCSAQILLSNPDKFPIDSTALYIPTVSGAWGFVAGHNNYNDSAKIEKFNITALGIDTFTLKTIYALIYWGANSTQDAEPEIGVLVVKSDQATVLHYESIDLNNPPSNVTLNNIQPKLYILSYSFPTPIKITGDFFAGLTFTYAGNQDTVGIISVRLRDNTHNIAGDNTAYEILNTGSFKDMKTSWNLPHPFNLHIYAFGDAIVNTPATDSFAVAPQTLCYDTLQDTQVVAKPNVYSGHIYRVDIIFNKSDGTADTTSTTAIDFEGYAITIDSIENGENVVFVFQSVCGGPYTVTITDTCPTIISAPIPVSPLPNIKVWATPDNKIFISSPEEITVSLFSVDGKELTTMKVTGTENIRVNSTGIYILKVSNGKTTKTLKIRIE